ncbi:hypothetical protein PENTCL1PPCAC_6888 [Pristionchus entomophagus]|uniref:RNase H type-1 domain-containing protein n=1 Tax=Pristionchus entomophagus TaxID=358040 RepID=A0AAV5SRF9_9BILA|nr:hypothetical protein PENTCL1PPCAC_6888 [Pristionchus entomophagus]
MFNVFDEEDNPNPTVVHTYVVRRRLMANSSFNPNVTRSHGIGVAFQSMQAWNKCSNFEGTTCGAAAHAVIIALEELLKHPDDLDENWMIETRCQYLVDTLQTGSTRSSMCSTCRFNGDPAHVAVVRRLLRRFPRPVRILHQIEKDEKARRLAFTAVRRLYGKGDSDCSDEEQR